MKKLLVLSLAIALSLLTIAVAGQAQARPGEAGCVSGAGENPDKLLAAGLTADGHLVCFRIDKPGQATDVGVITGLTGDTGLVGIDYRVQNGQLYGVGDNGGLYTIDPLTAVASKVGTLSVALQGSAFGVDFNPAANALRIVSDSGQNLRVTNIDNTMATPLTTIADTTLTTPPATTPTSGVLGAAYTNNDLDPTTATTLFDLNAVANTVQIQSPANSGQLVNTGVLGVDATNGDLDVYTRAGGANEAYAVLVTTGGTVVAEIDLLTAKLGRSRAADGIIDIAIPVNQ